MLQLCASYWWLKYVHPCLFFSNSPANLPPRMERGTFHRSVAPTPITVSWINPDLLSWPIVDEVVSHVSSSNSTGLSRCIERQYLAGGSERLFHRRCSRSIISRSPSSFAWGRSRPLVGRRCPGTKTLVTPALTVSTSHDVLRIARRLWCFAHAYKRLTKHEPLLNDMSQSTVRLSLRSSCLILTKIF